MENIVVDHRCRKYTEMLKTQIEDGIVSKDEVIEACLQRLPENIVRGMFSEGLFPDPEGDEYP